MAEDLIIRSNHVGFTVEDLDRGIAMFSDLFGYAVVSRGGRNPRGVGMLTGVPDPDIEVVHLRRDGFIGVELIHYRTPIDRSRASGLPCDAGYTHLTYDVRDVDCMVERAAAYGLKPVGQIVGNKDTGGPRKGTRVVYLKDPEGLNIELIQPPED